MEDAILSINGLTFFAITFFAISQVGGDCVGVNGRRNYQPLQRLAALSGRQWKTQF